MLQFKQHIFSMSIDKKLGKHNFPLILTTKKMKRKLTSVQETKTVKTQLHDEVMIGGIRNANQ